MSARVPALAVLGLIVVMPAAAQVVGSGAVLQSYRFDDPSAAGLATIRLFTTPFAFTAPIGSTVVVQAAGAFAQGVATSPDGQRVTLSGFTDTYLGVSTAVGLDWLVVTARMSLPTGSYTHTAAESLVASVVAAQLLPFAVNTWGSGGSYGANVAAVTQTGGWGVGVAGGYSIASEYEPLRNQEIGYRPGDQLQVRLALDHDLGASGTFSALVGFQNFGDDQLAGNDLFRSGSRIEAMLSYAFAVGRRSSALVYGGVNHRANGTLLLQASALGGASDAPSQQLFLFGTNARVPVGRRSTFLPAVEARVFRASDGASQGWITSAGASLETRISGLPSGRRVVLEPSGRLRLGRVIVGEGIETGVTGWEAGVTLRVVVGR